MWEIEFDFVWTSNYPGIRIVDVWIKREVPVSQGAQLSANSFSSKKFPKKMHHLGIRLAMVKASSPLHPSQLMPMFRPKLESALCKCFWEKCSRLFRAGSYSRSKHKNLLSWPKQIFIHLGEQQNVSLSSFVKSRDTVSNVSEFPKASPSSQARDALMHQHENQQFPGVSTSFLPKLINFLFCAKCWLPSNKHEAQKRFELHNSVWHANF